MKFNEPPVLDRSCGSCSVCCHVMGVKDILNKPNFTDCLYQIGSGGCSIYEQRPRPCRTFECMYRSGHWGISEKDRPDQSGIMMVAVDERMGEHLVWLTAWLTRPPDERMMYWLTKVAKQRPIAIRYQQNGENKFQILAERREMDIIARQIHGAEVK